MAEATGATGASGAEAGASGAEAAAYGAEAGQVLPASASSGGPGRAHSPPTLTLVLLAAGMGSRYGGMKQLEAVGPAGETLMDYSVHDAIRAGFERAVFVIRPDMEAPFREYAEGRFGDRIHVVTALQRLEDVPVPVPPERLAARAKPWGTGQAVLAAAGVVPGPFVVLNADDFYGRRAFQAQAEFLRGRAGEGAPAATVAAPAVAAPTNPARPPLHTWSLVGYRLGDTASAAGAVNRGVCRAEGGWLQGVEEVLELRQDDNGRFTGRAAAGEARFDADTLVSMNFWGFTPAVFDLLRRDFRAFLEAEPSPRAEFLLPTVIGDALRAGEARVRVLDAGSRWWGITYPGDRPLVEAGLRRLVEQREYPPRLLG
jgi:MobA-like NTP transferase domain